MKEVIKKITENKRLIGMWGFPDPEVLNEVRKKYPHNKVLDLDVDNKFPSSGILPDAYCRIIRNIIDNSILLREHIDIIVAAVGEEKCDAGRFAALLLTDLGFNVIQTRYNEYSKNSEFNLPISTSSLPLKDKITKIMDGVIDKVELDLTPVKPEFGFWGVAPNDFSILELFPDSTHVYGWTRCVEAGRPADLDLEMFVDEGVPTVFFAQTFCAKTQLAKYLAKKYNGLYVDVDDYASRSVMAKIEAFLRLQ